MFPREFVENITQSLGERKCLDLLSALEKDPVVSFRINPFKGGFLDLPLNDPVQWSDFGYYLDTRPIFNNDPLFHCGAYYVQEASSMSIEVVKRILPSQHQPLKVLDLCAAPGGKSTHILSLLKEYDGSFLVSNEVINARATILAENLAKWGTTNTVVTNNDPADFKSLPNYFDLILVDAPCSGEGMFRKDKNAREEWSLENVKICAARQKRIVSDIWPSLKEGGTMIYSTCTFNNYENDENVEWMVKEFNCDPIIVQHFLPGDKCRGEGFFMAIIRKNGVSSNSGNRKRAKQTLPKVYSSWHKPIEYLKDDCITFLRKDMIKGYPLSCFEEMLYVESQLKCIQSGVAVAQLKGDILIPQADIALSIALNEEGLNQCEVSYDDAIKFLSREAVVLNNEPKGYLLLKYRGYPLGFVKNIGNRSNNLWPTAWRKRI